MTHPQDNPVRAELQSLDQRRADTLADALRPDAAPTGDDAEVLRLREECARLRAIIAGRTVPPTNNEVAALHARRGRWLLSAPPVPRVVGGSRALAAADEHRALRSNWSWIALDATGRPCAWPVVDGGESREGEGR